MDLTDLKHIDQTSAKKFTNWIKKDKHGANRVIAGAKGNVAIDAFLCVYLSAC